MVESASALRRAVLSAYSLRMVSPESKILLATDYGLAVDGVAEALLPSTMRARLERPLFDRVIILNESFVDAATDLVSLLSRHPESRAGRVARSRIGRLRLLADPPCLITLFLDDDTYFCEPPPALSSLFSSSGSDLLVPDARAFMFFKSEEEHKIDAEARECERGGDPENLFSCYDRAGSFVPKNVCSGAQGGAVAVSRSARASRFARDWLDVYTRDRVASLLKATDKKDRERMIARMNWLDQSALRSLSLEKCASKREDEEDWTLGHLPYVLNYRAVKKYSFLGKVRIVHQKALFPMTTTNSTISSKKLEDQARHMDAVCHRLNHDVSVTTERHPTMYEELRDLSFAPPDAQPPSAKRRSKLRQSSSSSSSSPRRRRRSSSSSGGSRSSSSRSVEAMKQRRL